MPLLFSIPVLGPCIRMNYVLPQQSNSNAPSSPTPIWTIASVASVTTPVTAPVTTATPPSPVKSWNVGPLRRHLSQSQKKSNLSKVVEYFNQPSTEQRVVHCECSIDVLWFSKFYVRVSDTQN